MNYAGTFGTDFSNDAPVSLTDHHIKMDSAGASVAPGPIAHDTILIPDAQLLFAGDFNRLGNDLMLSKDGHEFLVPDYFLGEKRAFLASPDGANLSGDVVQALTGHVQYAQAGGAQSAPKDIGQVSKLVGTATVIRNGVLVELQGGDRVYKGDVVQAGANSSCTIVFVDGSVFGLSANARMVLNEMVYDQAGASNSALISLVRGTISFVAGETAKHGDMKVETPVATMGIRGTAVLVEIGFEIPSDGKGPPVNFQVLVEPDGSTGSYIIYSKSDPSMVIGTIDRAGQVFSVSGNGTFSNLPSPEMSQMAASIIQQVFTQRFPGYVPDKLAPTPQGGGGGSTPANPPSDNIPKLHDTPGDVQVTDITVEIPDGSGGTKTVKIPVGSGLVDVAPTITFAALSVFKHGMTVLKASDITVIDPDNTSFTITPTVTYGKFQVLNTNGQWVDAPKFTSADLAASHVRFVPDGSGSIPTISFVANDGILKSVPYDVIVNRAFAPFHLVEAGATGPGHSLSVDQLAIGSAGYDTEALAANHWIDNGDGTWSLHKTYGIVTLNTNANTNTLTYELNNNDADSLKSTDHRFQPVSVDLLNNDAEHTPFQIKVTFVVDGKNDAPVAYNDTAHIYAGQTSVTHNTPMNGLLANDQDVEHDSLSISSVETVSPSGGSFIVEGRYGELVVNKDTGAYTYKLGVTHAQSEALAHLHPGQDATDTFSYKATDGSANSNQATLTVSFDKPYDFYPPDAHSDNLIISAGAFENGGYGLKSVTFDNFALLKNDKDNDSDFYHNNLYVDDYYNNFSFGHANSTLNGEDTVYSIASYQLPGAGKTVHDSFNYTAIDHLGSSSDAARVDVTIVGANSNYGPKTYTLNSTHDDDVLIGGADSKENFVFKPGMGQDTIVDFHSGQDKIVLSGFSIYDIPSNPYVFQNWLNHHTTETTVSGVASTVIDLNDPFDWGQHEKITVVGVTPQHLNANDFIIHPGGWGY